MADRIMKRFMWFAVGFIVGATPILAFAQTVPPGFEYMTLCRSDVPSCQTAALNMINNGPYSAFVIVEQPHSSEPGITILRYYVKLASGCPDGYSQSGKQCVLPDPEPECPDGQSIVNGQCRADTECTAGETSTFTYYQAPELADAYCLGGCELVLNSVTSEDLMACNDVGICNVYTGYLAEFQKTGATCTSGEAPPDPGQPPTDPDPDPDPDEPDPTDPDPGDPGNTDTYPKPDDPPSLTSTTSNSTTTTTTTHNTTNNTTTTTVTTTTTTTNTYNNGTTKTTIVTNVNNITRDDGGNVVGESSETTTSGGTVDGTGNSVEPGSCDPTKEQCGSGSSFGGTCEAVKCQGDAIQCAIAREVHEANCREEGKSLTVTGEGGCESFDCKGDSIQCQIARSNWESNCNLRQLANPENDFAVDFLGSNAEFTGLGEGSNVVPRQETSVMDYFELRTWVSGSGSCPSTFSVPVFGRDVTIDLSWICPYLGILSFFLQAAAWLYGLRVVSEAI